MIGGAIFGVVIPYAAIAVFIVGILYKVIGWAESPVPLKIPTTCGQQYTLPFLRRTIYDRFDCPQTMWETVGRMFFEIFFFRSLFRNTRFYYAPQMKYKDARWLWLFGIAFHYSLLLVLIDHLRFFMEPVPWFSSKLTDGLSLTGVFVPTLYLPGLLIVVALALLWARRLFFGRERTISLPSDHFVLILLLAITISGNLMRYFYKVDLADIKELILCLSTFNVAKAVSIADALGPIFYIHLTLVSLLLAYFPFSKLMHSAGVFFSPTRNMPNDNRVHIHINPWNPEIKGLTYEQYYEMYKDQLDEIAEEGYKVKPEV